MLFTVLGAYRRAISSFHASTCSLSTRPPWGSRAAKASKSRRYLARVPGLRSSRRRWARNR